MARRYIKCAFCDNYTRDFKVQRCFVCGIPLCNAHHIHGLCQKHAGLFTVNQAKYMMRQQRIQRIVVRVGYYPAVFSFIFIFTLFGGIEIIGFASIGIFVFTVLTMIIVSRVAKKNIEKTLTSRIQELTGAIQGMVDQATKQIHQSGAPPSTAQPLPPPPPSGPSVYSPPPPSQQYPTNQASDFDIKQTNHSEFEEKAGSGLHTCRHCFARFELRGESSVCPYCQKPLY